MNGDKLMNRSLLTLLLLSMAAGAVDVIGFLGLGGLFAAHITGNIVILGAHLVTGHYSTIGPILAVPVFMVVLCVVTLIGGCIEKTRSPFIPLLILQAILLVGSFALGGLFAPFIDFNSPLAVITGMLAVAAMATQSAAIKLSIKKAPSTVAMTNNVTQISLDIALLAGWHKDNAQERTLAKDRIKVVLTCFLGFIVGCGLGALLQVTFGFGSFLFPTVLTFLAAFTVKIASA